MVCRRERVGGPLPGRKPGRPGPAYWSRRGSTTPYMGTALLVPLNVTDDPVDPVTVGSVDPADCTIRLIGPAPLYALLESSCHGGQWFPLDVLLDPLPCYGAIA